MATKFALQAGNGYKIRSHDSGLLSLAKGANSLKLSIFTIRQLVTGDGISAIRVGCAFNPNRLYKSILIGIRIFDAELAAVTSLSMVYLLEPYFSVTKVSLGICHDYAEIINNKNWIVRQVSGDSRKGYMDSDGGTVPTPIVSIDQGSDPNATIVEISFGDRLGALLDTMKALQDLGLDVAKASVFTEASITRTKFFITRLDTDRKVEDPELLERIRLTIINNLLKYHPESSERLAMGEAFGAKPPKKKLDVDIATHIHIDDDGPRRSTLYLETADRPGLLLEIIKVITDTNVTVESAEIDTEGLVAKDKFHVSYQGAALSNSIAKVLTNSLRYYLRRPETDEGSY